MASQPHCRRRCTYAACRGTIADVEAAAAAFAARQDLTNQLDSSPVHIVAVVVQSEEWDVRERSAE